MDGYVINLARRPDRLQAFREDFEATSLNVENFVAVDGRDLSLDDIKKPVNPWYIAHGKEDLILGNAGCQFSHEAIWRQIAELPDGLYIVLEDDARLIYPGAADRVKEAIAKAPQDADLVWLNDFDAAARIRFSSRLRGYVDRSSGRFRLGTNAKHALEALWLRSRPVVYKRWPSVVYTTTESYLIRPKYAKRLVEYTEKIVDSVDGQIKSAIDNMGGNIYVIYPRLFRQVDRSDSNIR